MKKESCAILFAIALLGGWIAPSFTMAEAQASSGETCDLVREQTVEWVALGETVTFRTKLYETGEYTPSATYTLIRADGTEVDLGGGGKFIDDWTKDDQPSCEDHLGASFVGPSQYTPQTSTSKAPTSLSIRDHITGETVADIMSDAACLANDLDRANLYENRPDRNDTDAYAAFRTERRAARLVETSCQDKREIQKQYAANPELLLHLIAINAPILEIVGSAYYSSVVAFDPETNTTYGLFYAGC